LQAEAKLILGFPNLLQPPLKIRNTLAHDVLSRLKDVALDECGVKKLLAFAI